MDLNESWELTNINYDKDLLLEAILRKGEDFGVLYENPNSYKWHSDMWFEQHKRTFEKWFDAFDIPYAPLENQGKFEDVLSNTNDKGIVSSTVKGEEDHIGHNISSSDNSSESLENENSKESNNLVATEGSHEEGTKTSNTTGSNSETTAEDTTGQKLSGTDESASKVSRDIYDENKSFDEDDTVDIRQDYTDSTKDTTKTVETPDDKNGRTVETQVSGYNDDDYVPSQLEITKGTMTTEHVLDNGNPNLVVNHKTNDAAGDDPNANNRTHTIIDRDESVSGLKSGTIDDTKSTDSTEDTTGSLDRQVDGEHSEDYNDSTTNDSTGHRNEITDKDTNTNSISSTKGNENSSSADEYRNNTTTTTEKTDINSRDYKSNIYTHGNVDRGVLYQDMLTAEIRVQLFNLYDEIAELYIDDMCIRVYPSRRGGCCCYDY